MPPGVRGRGEVLDAASSRFRVSSDPQPIPAADVPSPPRRAWLWAVPAEQYPVYLKTRTFALRKIGRPTLEKIRSGDTVFAYLSGLKVIAGMFEAVGEAFYDATPLVAGGAFPHRLRVRPLVALSEEAWVPYQAFHDRLDVTGEYVGFRQVVQQVIHPLPKVDEKVLEFLVRARQAADLETVLEAYDAYLQAKAARGDGAATVPGQEREARSEVHEPPVAYAASDFDRPAALEALIGFIEAQGFVYEPWQVAAYVTALRTKPLVILAGVTGTGKSKLPALVAAATGGEARLLPVRPDWTDSADVLGYTDLQGRFRPGAVLQVAREAAEVPQRHVTCIIDEMNLARVEQYFAEVLSRIEDRRPAQGGGFESAPLLDGPLQEAQWADVRLPSNLAFAGTVNMDESAHGFSRKVLDRAFTLELADVDLTRWMAKPPEEPPLPVRWPVAAWFPRALSLGGLADLNDEERARVDRAIEALQVINASLTPAQVQVAYRTRDEVALFVLHAAEVAASFRTRTGAVVDPLDLALHMKVLPRLVGGSRPLRQAIFGLLGWATGNAFPDEASARALLDVWEEAGRPNALPEAALPRTAGRLCLMAERLLTDGFTSFWL